MTKSYLKMHKAFNLDTLMSSSSKMHKDKTTPPLRVPVLICKKLYVQRVLTGHFAQFSPKMHKNECKEFKQDNLKRSSPKMQKWYLQRVLRVHFEEFES